MWDLNYIPRRFAGKKIYGSILNQIEVNSFIEFNCFIKEVFDLRQDNRKTVKYSAFRKIFNGFAGIIQERTRISFPCKTNYGFS